MNAQILQTTRALGYGQEVIEGLETVDESVASMSDDVLPTVAISDLVDRHFDDAEVFGLPVRSDDEAIADILELIFMIPFAR